LVIGSARARTLHAKKLVTTVRKHPGLQAILTTLSPGASKLGRRRKDVLSR
jgi:hypothetical protein